MATISQDQAETQGQDGPKSASQTFNDIVISGMASTMAGCSNIEEFTTKLYNKEDLVKQSNLRWSKPHPEVPPHIGIIPEVDRFDFQFFSVSHRLVNNVDIMSRKLLELSFAAIFDAGLSSSELSGRNIGVFVATSICEGEQIYGKATGRNGIAGGNRAMFANRISYYLNSHGPSIVVDSHGCGSLVALQIAKQAIENGTCEAAIVGACRMLLHPHSIIHYGRVLPLTTESKSYDKNGKGLGMSEAIHVMYLQKRKDAKRIYSTLCHVQTGYMKPKAEYEFGFIRETEGLETFLKDFYTKAGIPASNVNYVEGLGVGIVESDTVELEVFDSVFAKDRKTPLLVGSVTSNLGYTEAASGFSSIAKVLLAHNKGSIAPNLHCDEPLEIGAIKNGRIRIVTEEEKFNGGYTAVNSYSLLGGQAHALFKSDYMQKDLNKYATSTPYLVIVSGRNKEAVNKILIWLKSHPIDPEEISLLNSIHKNSIRFHLARGYAVYTNIPNEDPKVLKLEVDQYNDMNCPLWFVYSGMGSQWAGMGKELMKIPVFSEAMRRCDKVLSKKGLNIVDIITSSEKTVFDNILHCFVGIAAVQIGITDVLRTIGIVPDKIIGHSAGEMGCAYADNCVTAEEMILMSYYRGLVSLETDFIKGSMAAVGLGCKQIKKLLPPEVDIACHNSATSCTISGPADVIKTFVSELTSQGIFTREIPCSNIAYHSRYITNAETDFLKYCKSVISSPKIRSERWVSTSVPQEEWDTKGKFSSAEYHVNNLLNPVLFEEASQLITANAVLIEIAPHCLLQAILQKSLPKDCVYIPLTRRGHPDNAAALLEGIGKLYQQGYRMDVNNLYPKIEYPVSTATKNLSHLVEFDHREQLNNFALKPSIRHKTTTYNPIVTLHDEEHVYLRGCCKQGKIVLPHAAILNYVWDILVMTLNVPKEGMNLQFENLHFYSEPILTENSILRPSCQLHRASGDFEVIIEKSVIATGNVRSDTTKSSHDDKDETPQIMDVDSETIYKLLLERGYQPNYHQFEKTFVKKNWQETSRDAFKVIQRSDIHLNHAEIKLNGNWVTFIDGILQMMILKTGPDTNSKLEHIHKLTINNKRLIDVEKCPTFQFHYCQHENSVKCGTVYMENVTFKNTPSAVQEQVIKYKKFIPFHRSEDYDKSTSLYIFFQIISENVSKTKLNVVEIKNATDENIIDEIEQLMHAPQDKPLNKTIILQDLINKMNSNEFNNVDVVIFNKINEQVFEILFKIVPQNTFIINIAHHADSVLPTSMYKIVASMTAKSIKLELAIWRQIPQSSTTSLTVKTSSHFKFLRDAHANLRSSHKLLVLTTYPPPAGLIDLVKELRSKRTSNQVLTAMVDEESSMSNLEKTANLDLAFNVLKQNKWGGEYYVLESKKKPNVVANVKLQCTKPGDLNTVSWVEVPVNTMTGIPVEVHFAGLNVYDARVAIAEVPSSYKYTSFGMDFSGITKSGERVMGIVSSGAATLVVNVEPDLLWPVPRHWSLEDASTVPMPYCIAFYSLAVIGQLSPRQNILVHGGAGAVGQAAISIALFHGCNVFTTVSDRQKKRFLRRLFPSLPAENIGNSRDDSFSEMVLLKTKGEGCSIIISSVKENLKNPTLKCCGCIGQTVDLVQIHTRENYNLGMMYLNEKSYTAIDFAALLNQKQQDIIQKLHCMISEGIKQGYVRPLTRVTYDACEVGRGLRLLAASRHRGRVLLNMKTLTPEIVVPKVLFNPEKYKLIFCDEEEFGAQFVDTLVKHGAKKIVLQCPKPSTILNVKKHAWNTLGAEIIISFANIEDKIDIKELFEATSNVDDIDGIYILSMGQTLLEDIIPKVDDISRKMGLTLRHFAIITQDQATGSTTYSERIKNGLPASRIQLLHPEMDRVIEDSNNTKTLSHRSYLHAIRSILTEESVSVVICANSASEINILSEVSKITVTDLTNVDEKTTLENAGIDESLAELVCMIVEDKFGIHLNKYDVPHMTVGELKSLDNKPKAVPAQGLQQYFDFIDSNETEEFSDFYSMKTLLESTDTCIDEFNADVSYLCIVPGLEGHNFRFVELCERLKIRAIVLQPGFERQHKSIDDIAQRLVLVMKRKLKVNNEFYLLGYEFGVEVALRMAQIFENSGMTGTVYCLGGEPEEIKSFIVSDLNYNTENELQNAVVQHIYNKLNRNRLAEIDTKLKAASNWKEKVDICDKLLRGNSQQPIEFIRDLLETLYSRIKILQHTDTNTELFNSKIVLIRGKVSKKLSDDTLRSRYGNDIVVHDVEVNIAMLPEDLRVSNFINKYLPQNIVDEYNQGNRCESVLIQKCEYF